MRSSIQAPRCFVKMEDGIMRKIIWRVRPASALPIRRYCKKCGGKTVFYCSGQFRVNACRRLLDIWLIYKCSDCDTTWNAAVYSRVTPQSLPAGLLDCFHNNDKSVVEKYATDAAFLRKNGAEVCQPDYTVEGDCFNLGESVELEIESDYPLPVKAASVIRGKLRLSQKVYETLIADGNIMAVPNQDLHKCRLNNRIHLLFR